jgi:putative flippase GtrA
MGRMEQGKTQSLIALLSRFGIAGLINTALGFGVIAALDLGLHVEPHIANLAGYAIGVVVSFALSRQFVFRNQDRLGPAMLRYLLVVALAFLLNQAVLSAVMGLTQGYGLSHMAGQLAGIAAYTVMVFVACKFWVFKSAPSG